MMQTRDINSLLPCNENTLAKNDSDALRNKRQDENLDKALETLDALSKSSELISKELVEQDKYLELIEKEHQGCGHEHHPRPCRIL